MSSALRRLMLALALLPACATTGGTAFGLFPMPKFLDGTIEGGTLYVGGDGAFEVALPHAEGTYEHTYMSVKEQGMPGGWYVSFGPAALDQAIYRVEVGLANDPEVLAANFDRTFEAWLQHAGGQLEAGYEAPLVRQSEGREEIGGHPARRVTYTQRVPTGKLGNVEVALTHEVFGLDLQRGAAFVWVQQSEEVGLRLGLAPREFAASVKLR